MTLVTGSAKTYTLSRLVYYFLGQLLSRCIPKDNFATISAKKQKNNIYIVPILSLDTEALGTDKGVETDVSLDGA